VPWSRVNDDSEHTRGGVAGAHGSPLEIQRRVLELIATGQDLDRVLNVLVLDMEVQHPSMRGSILLIAEDGSHFKTAAAPNLPARYQRLVEDLIVIGPTAGSCGTACFRRARVVTKDISSDPLWSGYTEIAEQFELRACWSEPIFARDGSVLGSFAMYYSEPRSPSTHELEKINIAARLAAIAVDRARADAALRRNEERLNFALTAAKMGTWDWDIERDYVAWSDGVESLFGLPRGAFTNDFAGYLMLIVEEDQGRVRAAIDTVLWGEAQDYIVEHRITWTDGSLHWLEGKGRVYRRPDGSPARMAGTVADISERKRSELALRESEEQLRQAQKMEAIGRLAGGVAHDFNNLLTAIGGYSSLALLELALDDPRREYLEEIQRAGERGASLTKQLLASGRKQVLSPKLLDLNALVDDLTSLLRRVIGEDVELDWRRASAPAVVFADAGQLEQIIINLAVNARDAMPEGGILSLASSSMLLEAGDASAPEGRYVRLRVSDTGHGMDEETMARMFEPFFTTKDPGKGTGLGLSTVYGIVQQLSGAIRARSAPGRGTRFEIYLPERERGALSEHPESSAVPASGGTETVLLVEDESQVRKLVYEVLQSRGYRVLAAKDALEAIPLEEDFPGRIELLITDLVMPGMSGRELAQHLSATRPETKVLFISGYTDDALLRHGATTPGTGFLQKPFALEDLLLRVRALLDETLSPTKS
jgi:two-component system, cell cycle sensor histidine kinase and response regulator CckA